MTWTQWAALAFSPQEGPRGARKRTVTWFWGQNSCPGKRAWTVGIPGEEWGRLGEVVPEFTKPSWRWRWWMRCWYSANHTRLGLKQVKGSARCLTNFSAWSLALGGCRGGTHSVSGVTKGVILFLSQKSSDTGKGHQGALSTATVDCEGAGGEGTTAEGPHPRALHKHLSPAGYLLRWDQSTSLEGLGEHFLSSSIFTFSSS